MAQQIAGNDTSWLYLLQEPRVSKRFEEKKKFGDHLFLEIGGGVNTTFKQWFPLEADKPGFLGNVAIGDWITPEHGVRFGFTAGTFNTDAKNIRAVALSADYLMNFSAVASPTYKKPKPVEFYGIVGAEANYSYGGASDLSQKYLTGWGVRLGLRGQFRISDYTYAYLEPRIGFYSENLLHSATGRDFRTIGSLSAGFGYRLQPKEYRSRHTDEADGSFLNGMFFSLWGGPYCLLTDISRMKDNTGARLGISGGKWFKNLHAVRINAQVGRGNNQNGHNRFRRYKTLTLSADYMLNLHNAFAGYNPSRRYWLNALAGFSANYSSGVHGNKPSVGFGGGLQANVRLGSGVDFFLEPRIDVYTQGYVTNFTTTKHHDATAALLAGLSFRRGDDTKELRRRNDDFKNHTWFDNIEIEAGLGALIPAHSYAVDHLSSFFSPKAFVAAGKWFTATSGARVWAEAGMVKSKFINREKIRNVGFGAEYMWNATNTFYGYRPQRPLELITTLGVNYNKQNHGGSFLGANASLKGVLHVNKIWGFFLEPQARFYNKSYIVGSTPGLNGDLTLAAVAGVQIRANGYRPEIDCGTFHEDGGHSFVSLAFGAGANGNELHWNDQYGIAGRLSYGKWFHPVAAWRANAEAYYKTVGHAHYVKGTVGADLMLDINAIAFGYDSHRFFTTRLFGGANLGIDRRSGISQTGFIPDIHAGGQFSFRLSSHVELYAEPLLTYQIREPRGCIGSISKFQPKAYLGLNYRFGGNLDEDYKDVARRSKKNFATAAIGTGINTQNFFGDGNLSEKLTFGIDLAYGRWLTGVSALRVGFSNTSLQYTSSEKRQLSSLHFDYMADLTAFATGESSEEKVCRLYGFAGVGVSSYTTKAHKRRWGFGGQAGFQIAFRVAPAFEVFAEPALHVMSASIRADENIRPAEADLKLMVGTKFSF